jgi:endonuclease/exonuclease/phosphatase family metal-dependent hydrolase
MKTREERAPSASQKPPANAGRFLVSVALVAVTVAVASQVLRVIFPLAFNLGERLDNDFLAAILTLSLFLGPVLAPPVRFIFGPRHSLWVAILALSSLRIAIQVVRPVPLGLGAAATVVALLALTLELMAVQRRGVEGGYSFALGIILGLAVDTGFRVGFTTWDYAWREGALPLALSIVVAAVLALTLWRAVPGIEAPPQPRTGRPIAVLLGPFLLLEMLLLQNLAFTAWSAGISVETAGGVVLVGDALAVAVVVWAGGKPPSTQFFFRSGAALVLLTWVATWATGKGEILVLLALQGLSGLLIAAALMRVAEGRPRLSQWHTPTHMAAGNALFVFLLFGYEFWHKVRLPVPNSALLVAAAVMLAFASLVAFKTVARAIVGLRAAWLVTAPLVILIVPLAVGLMRRDLRTEPAQGGSFRLVSYNVHMGVDTAGQIDPEAIAQVVESQAPDVVVLQEVVRGRAIAGTLDLAEWLSRRLGMPYVYGPAADSQFGNAVLTRFSLISSETGFLPKGVGSMRRGYVRVWLDLAGVTMQVISTHLEHTNRDARLRQIRVLLRAWGRAPRTVMGGDMNAGPGSREISLFQESALVSAQDVAGNPSLATWPSRAPQARIDWVFGTSDLRFSGFEIPPTLASDHLPLAVTVYIGR